MNSDKEPINRALTFGGWLKRRRGGLGLTQKELAQQIGYAEVTVRKVEADEVRPSRQMAEVLADALQVPQEERARFVRFARSQIGSSATVSLRQQLADLPPDPLAQSPAAVVDYTLVGRQMEWQTLRTAWATAVQSGAQLVLVAGEAGIGKTRLAEELLLHVQRQGHIAIRARAYALEGRLAYAPLADWLRSPPLQARLAGLDKVWLSEIARLLPELLIRHPDLPAPEPLTERWQQKHLFEAVLHAFTADSRPLLLLLDDLQWCDAETLAWLQYYVETAPQVPVVVVGTVRSDELDDEHPLHKLRRALLRAGRLSTIDLAPLSVEYTAALGAEVREYALDSVAATSLFQATAATRCTSLKLSVPATSSSPSTVISVRARSHLQV